MTQSPLGPTQGQPRPFDAPETSQPNAVPPPSTTPLAEPAGAGDRPYAGTTEPYDSGRGATSTSEGPGPDSSGGSAVDTAKGEAKEVASTAVDSGKEVAATAKDEAKNVVAETKQQAASLLETVRTEAGQQASTQQQRIAEVLHGLAKELGSMASSTDESGPITELAQQASRKGGEIAHWLQEREPADVLEAVRSYARRRPVTFLALCGLAGVVAGRLTRSTVATRTSLDSRDATESRGEWPPAAGTTTYSKYAVDPTPAPYSTGVLGATPESTEPVASKPYTSDPPLPGGGYVGTSPTSDPRGDLNR